MRCVGRSEVELDVLGDLGSDGLARAAPCRKGIDDDDIVLGDSLLELGNATHGNGLLALVRLLSSSRRSLFDSFATSRKPRRLGLRDKEKTLTSRCCGQPFWASLW